VTSDHVKVGSMTVYVGKTTLKISAPSLVYVGKTFRPI